MSRPHFSDFARGRYLSEYSLKFGHRRIQYDEELFHAIGMPRWMQDAEVFYARILSADGSNPGSLCELTHGVNRQWATCRGCSVAAKTDHDIGTL